MNRNGSHFNIINVLPDNLANVSSHFVAPADVPGNAAVEICHIKEC